jgi:catechol 2,3-dioxygenase-like lactoylglutathione lyase family enzyme
LQSTLALTRTDVGVANTSRTVPIFAVGKSALAVFATDDPFLGGTARAGLHHIAFSAGDPEHLATGLQAQDLFRSTESAGRGLANGKRVALNPSRTAGVRVCFTQPIALSPSSTDKVQRLDHIGIASASNTAGIDIFCGKLGLAFESSQTDMEVEIAVESFTSDKYGAVYHTRPPRPVGGLRVAFITAGDCELEFLQNFDPAQGSFIDRASAGTTRQDQGAISRYIAKRGAGLHHIAFKVTDIDAMLAHVRGDGFATIDQVGRPGSRRALIGFMQPQSVGGILFHFVQRQ